MRNVMKQAKEGRAKIESRHDLLWDELEQLAQLSKTRVEPTDIWEVITNAFYMGYNVGCNHPSDVNA